MKRSKWKGVYIRPNKNIEKTFVNYTVSRKTSIIPKFIGETIKIHNGKNFKELLITKDMLHHKLGEFFKTRTNFKFKKNKNK